MDDYMNNDQYNVFLENIAKLIEANANTVEEAAQIVRDSKDAEIKRLFPHADQSKGKSQVNNKGGDEPAIIVALYFIRNGQEKQGRMKMRNYMKEYREALDERSLFKCGSEKMERG